MNRALLTRDEIIENSDYTGIMLKLAEAAMKNDVDADVLDPHYGTTINSDLALAYHNGIYVLVGFDTTNQIVEVTDNKKGPGLVFDNTNILGSRKADRVVSGWAFDREDSFIFGYESDGYYKENK